MRSSGLLHSTYNSPHRPNHRPTGAKVARGEATMWAAYQVREVALYVPRLINGEPYYASVPGLADRRGL